MAEQLTIYSQRLTSNVWNAAYAYSTELVGLCAPTLKVTRIRLDGNVCKARLMKLSHSLIP